ncbi:MAG: hypothetical protein DRP54_05850 [Spirochaetes bacterium]|nr:MAG: hypothetical protein DRP54_05850 [Spirochaetota bacterium]
MGHNNKWSRVNFDKCNPFECDPANGVYRAAQECSKELLIQEDPGDLPILVSQALCKGCGICVVACPLKAIDIERGL